MARSPVARQRCVDIDVLVRGWVRVDWLVTHLYFRDVDLDSLRILGRLHFGSATPRGKSD
jgi:hypothetical protein